MTSLQSRFDRLIGLRDAAVSTFKQLEFRRDELADELAHAQKAQSIIQAVAQATQLDLETRVSGLTTLAMQSVFPNPYALRLKFELKRGRTEASFSFIRDGLEVEPKFGSGGGPIDVAAFALRLAVWSIKAKRTRAVMVLDEPFKWVSKAYRPKIGLLLKELARDLGIQIIMVTHDEVLIDHADKVFQVKISDGVSKVEVV